MVQRIRFMFYRRLSIDLSTCSMDRNTCSIDQRTCLMDHKKCMVHKICSMVLWSIGDNKAAREMGVRTQPNTSEIKSWRGGPKTQLCNRKNWHRHTHVQRHELLLHNFFNSNCLRCLQGMQMVRAWLLDFNRDVAGRSYQITKSSVLTKKPLPIS